MRASGACSDFGGRHLTRLTRGRAVLALFLWESSVLEALVRAGSVDLVAEDRTSVIHGWDLAMEEFFAGASALLQMKFDGGPPIIDI